MDVPEDVLEVFAAVRADGTVHMFDRDAVLRRVSAQDTPASAQAFVWLVGEDGIGARATPAQRTRYLAALARIAG